MYMNKKLKQQLQAYYQAPAPKGKEKFLRQTESPGISAAAFVRMQLPYMGKWNWILSAVIFGLLAMAVREANRYLLWSVSAMLPYLAVSFTAELNRPARWGMEELERACRFPLKMVLLARTGILGAGNLLLLAVAAPVTGFLGQLSAAEAGLAVLLPYLLTSFLTMAVIRHVRGRESHALCIACGAAVSFGCVVFRSLADAGLLAAGRAGQSQWMLADERLWLWVLAALLLLTGREWRIMMKQMEDYVWN